ncbi:phenylacetate--CoA ligase family protein [Nocardioides aurantiacus]|uniref:phenylacetate--CoA ligase family protein n=1 Tax=Nocardioides aurantiacus TaxID=86796 RepID=UPI00403F5D23
MRRTLDLLEHAAPDEVRDWQDRRLRRIVAWAARTSPFYRSWFATSDVSPADIRTQDDLPLLPLIDRGDLTADPERFCSYPRRLMWPARSSGTSGQVVTVYRTPGASTYEINALQRQWAWFGLPRGARRVVVRAAGAGLGAEDPDEVATLVPGARQLLVSGYVVAAADPERLLRTVREFRPDAMEGWPSSLSALANLMADRGETLPVRAVITSSEMMTQDQVATLERVFCAPVVDHYGQTERVTLAGGCEAGGYHLFPDYAVTELLPVPGLADQWEIVGTPLHNWGFPLLRYRTGDTVGPTPGGLCGCGRSFPRLGAIGGRAEDSFTAADGRTIPLPATVIDDVQGLEEVQVAQRSPGVFEIRMVPRTGTDVLAVQSEIRGNVDRYFGRGQHVGFVVTGRIPRSPSGKLRPAVLDPGTPDPSQDLPSNRS